MTPKYMKMMFNLTHNMSNANENYTKRTQGILFLVQEEVEKKKKKKESSKWTKDLNVKKKKKLV